MKQILDFFNDKLFLTFTMFILLFYIIFYQFINNSIKMKIFNMISNPIVLLVLIGFIGVILYHNFTVGMIILFSVLISISYKSEKEEEIVNTNEGFKDSFVTEQMKNVLNTLSDGIEENKNIE